MGKKENIGRIIWFTALIVAIVIMAGAMFITSDETKDNKVFISNLRYMIAFYSFLGIISPAALVYEYCKGKYDIKRYRLKFIILIPSLIVGTLVYILAPNPTVISFMFLVSLLVFVLMITPSNKVNK